MQFKYKHDYVPKSQTKFLNQVQTVYPKKNWSSFMLMNCKKCSTLTPDYVNKASGLELHQFKWLESESLIGEVPLEWNWLADEYEYKKDVNNIHTLKAVHILKHTKTAIMQIGGLTTTMNVHALNFDLGEKIELVPVEKFYTLQPA